MAKGLDDKSVETLVVDLVQGVTDVNQLNLAKANQRQAFFQALEERPAILTKVSSFGVLTPLSITLMWVGLISTISASSS